jgi:hypothetical protein
LYRREDIIREAMGGKIITESEVVQWTHKE